MNEKGDQIYEPTICQSCGASFGCGAKLDGCWCTSVELTAEVSAQLRSNYNDCLCKNCLEELKSGIDRNENSTL